MTLQLHPTCIQNYNHVLLICIQYDLIPKKPNTHAMSWSKRWRYDCPVEFGSYIIQHYIIVQNSFWGRGFKNWSHNWALKIKQLSHGILHVTSHTFWRQKPTPHAFNNHWFSERWIYMYMYTESLTLPLIFAARRDKRPLLGMVQTWSLHSGLEYFQGHIHEIPHSRPKSS